MAPSRRPLAARMSPPPSRTSTGSSSSESRVTATRASATTSAARRSTISAATSSRLGLGEDHRCELEHAPRRDPPEVDRLGELLRRAPARSAPGTRASSVVFGPRPSSLRAAADSAASPTSWPPPQSPVIVPSAGKRACRPSGATPTQLMPAPHTTATPQPRSVPARRIANVSLLDRRARRPAARLDRRLQGSLLDRQVGAGEQDVADLGDRLLGRRGRAASASASRSSSTRRQPVEPDVVRRAQRPARDAPAARRRRARARGRSSSCRRRRPGRSERSRSRPASRAEQAVEQRLDLPHCPTSGCASSALRAVAGRRRPPPPRRAARRRRRAATRPSSSGASGALRQRHGAVRAHARRDLDDVVVGEPGERAAVAHVDDVDRAVAASPARR